MVILHVASIKNTLFSGVSVVVPQHVRAQSEFATVGFINVQNIKIDGMEEMFSFNKKEPLKSLPSPFHKPDLVVFHEVYYPKFLGFSKKLRKAQIPYIIIPHGCLRKEAQRKKRLKKWLGNLVFFNRFIKGAKAIQSLSQWELECTKFGKNKFISTNGIFLPQRVKQSFQKDKQRFVYIGRLDIKVKGLDLLISAVKLVKEQLREQGVTVDLYGPDFQGQYAAVDSLIAQSQVGDIVRLHGAIIGEEKERILLDGDIFLQTSRNEGMPMGILEALAYGVPCLVTKGTTLGELIEEQNAGWCCETTAQGIAQMLLNAIDERKTYEEKSINARALIENFFVWNVIAKETVDKYQELINE